MHSRKTEGEDDPVTKMMCLQAKECQRFPANPEARRGKERVSPGAIKESMALISDFWPPECERTNLCCF